MREPIVTPIQTVLDPNLPPDHDHNLIRAWAKASTDHIRERLEYEKNETCIPALKRILELREMHGHDDSHETAEGSTFSLNSGTI